MAEDPYAEFGAPVSSGAADPYADFGPPIAAVPPPPVAQPRTVFDQFGDAASEWWGQVNPVSGVQGLAEAARHPINTASNLLNAQGGLALKVKEALKKGNYAEAARHAANYMVPVLGPGIDEQGDRMDKGEYAKAVGGTLGIATNLATPQLLKGVRLNMPTRALSERMYQSALKPSTTYTAKEVGSMVKTGLENKIPVSGAGVAKLAQLIDDLNTKVSDQIAAGAKSGATIDKAAVASRLGDTYTKFTNQVNPRADLRAITRSRNEFMTTQPARIPAGTAQSLKQGTYKQLSSKAYGELSSATIESQKALARGIKEELEQQFPEIKGLNAREGKMIGLDEALQHAVKRIDNRDVFSLGSKVVTTGAAAVGGAPGAAASFVLHRVITSPGVQSKLAIALNRVQKGAIPLPAAKVRVAGYANALGQALAADSEQPNDSQSQQ